jgi:hypothetical protein
MTQRKSHLVSWEVGKRSQKQVVEVGWIIKSFVMYYWSNVKRHLN